MWQFGLLFRTHLFILTEKYNEASIFVIYIKDYQIVGLNLLYDTCQNLNIQHFFRIPMLIVNIFFSIEIDHEEIVINDENLAETTKYR